MALNTISQRIALEGAEDVLKQLADLGTAGERAFAQLQQAGDGMSPTLSGLSTIIGTVKDAFGQIGNVLGPVKDRFGEFGEALKGVFENVTKVAEVFGVGLVAGIGGGIAGFVELIKSSAEAGHQLEIQSGVLGLTVEQLQAYRKVAAEAGVDGDRVFTALTKLTQNLGKESEKLSQDTIKAFAALPAAMSADGAGVLRGSAQPEAGTNRGIFGIPPEAIASVNQYTEQFVKVAEAEGKALSVADIERYRQSVTKLAGDVTDVGEKFRLAAAQGGVPFPALTQGEELKRNALIAADPVLRLGVTLKDLQANGENLDPVIRKILDGLAGISDPAQKNQVALALLGRGAKELTEAFAGGSGSLEDALAKIKATGLGLSPEQAKLLADVEKQLVQLGAAATGLRNQLAVIFAPALLDVTKTFTDLLKNNADTFKAWAQVIANEVLPSIANLIKQFTGVGDAAKGVPGQAPLDNAKPAVGATEPPPGSIDTSAIDSVQSKLERFTAAVESIAGAISKAFTIIRGVLTSVADGFNSLFGTNFTAGGLAAVVILGSLSGAFTLLLPLLALVGALIAALASPIGQAALLLGVLAANIVHFWPQISEGASAAASTIGTAASAIGGFFASIPAGVASGFNAALGAVRGFFGFIGSSIQSLVEVVAPRIGPIFGSISTTIQAAFEPIGQFFGPIFGSAIAGAEELLNGLVDWSRGTVTSIIGAFANVGNAIRTAFEGAVTFVEGLFDGFINGIQSLAQRIIGVLQPVLSFIESIGSALARALGAAGSGAAAAPSDSPGLGIDSSGFATGGHVGGPSGTDRVPAWLTAGEYVVRAEAVDHYGTQVFSALNSMRVPLSDIGERFSLGGLVGAIAMRPPSPALRLADGGVVAGPRSVGTVNLSLDGKSFPLTVQPGEVFDKLSRHARSSAMRSAGRKPSWYAS